MGHAVARWIGRAAANALGQRGEAQVLASFSKATYLEVNGEPVVVVAESVPPGPLHLVVAASSVRVEENRNVRVSDGCLRLGGLTIHGLEETPPWEGTTPDGSLLYLHRSFGVHSLRALSHTSFLTDSAVSARVGQAKMALENREWRVATEALLGLGPGLTPSGDDALAGAFLTARSLGVIGDSIPPPWSDLEQRTTRLSLPFLRWAFLGQAIEPVHRLLHAVAAGTEQGCDEAVRVLGEIGATSGADLAWGLRTALDISPTWLRTSPPPAGGGPSGA